MPFTLQTAGCCEAKAWPANLLMQQARVQWIARPHLPQLVAAVPLCVRVRPRLLQPPLERFQFR